jgi:hypothetical protein
MTYQSWSTGDGRVVKLSTQIRSSFRMAKHARTGVHLLNAPKMFQPNEKETLLN